MYSVNKGPMVKRQQNLFLRVLHNVATDFDNKTFDTGRVIAIIYFFSAICFEGYRVFTSTTSFNPQEYLTGGAAFLAGLGAYIYGDASGRGKIINASPNTDPIVAKE
jgi:hypothetical protein